MASKRISEMIESLVKRPDQIAVSYDWSAVSDEIRRTRQFTLDVPKSSFPHINVTIPDSWPRVQIAPLYDVHLGSKEMDCAKFVRDIKWLANQPHTLVFSGGDLWDNAIALSVASPYSDDKTPNEQFQLAQEILKLLYPKLIFGIPGNHEDRTAKKAETDVSKILYDNRGIPYSPDYMIATIKWRGNKLRLLAHHGTGAAASPGGQRNAARKDMTWAHGFDLYWTGHLHQPLTDQIEVMYFDQQTDEPISKTVYSIISPSYLKYFGGYGAKKRLAPGARGLTVVTLQKDGRMDVESHANGKRL